MNEPGIHYGPRPTDPFAPRAMSKEQLRDLGFDPKGLSTREIKDAVKAITESQADFAQRVKTELEARDKAFAKPPATPVTGSTTVHPVSPIRTTPNVVPPRPSTQEGSATAGAFFTIFADGTATKLQGGAVNGYATPIPDFTLATSGTYVGSPGDHLVMTIDGDGAETSGILDPTFEVTNVSLAVSSTIGTSTMPEAGDVTGKEIKYSLGTFIDDGFLPALPGNINVSFCWGGYTITR